MNSRFDPTNTAPSFTSSQAPVPYPYLPSDPSDPEATTHDLNFNPSQRPGATLYTAYEFLSASTSSHVNEHSQALSSSHPTLDPTEKMRLVKQATASAYLLLYQHNELAARVDEESLTWELQCPRGCWVKTSVRSHNDLYARGQFAPLEGHWGSRFCGTQKSSDTRKVLASLFPRQVSLPQSSRINSSSQSPPASHASMCTVSVPCPGFEILDWPVPPGMPVQANLPWLRTADGIDTLTFEFEVVSRKPVCARSFDCTRDAADNGGACVACAKLEPKIIALADSARNRVPHTRHARLTPLQLVDVIHERDAINNTIKLQRLNDGRKIQRLLSELEDHSSLIMAFSQCDMPWLKNLLHTALRNGASISSIIRMIEEALERGYRPRGFSQGSIDLGVLILRLGGRNLLFALSQRLPIPSLRTLQRKLSFVKIHPVIGRITSTVIQQNITDVVVAPRAEACLMSRHGVSFLIDETALEEAASYISASNSVGGLCWTHSHAIDPTLNTYHSATNIAEALKDGRVHLGKELTVVAAHLFGEDSTYPILAAPTCKSENAADMEYIFTTVIESWYNSGADEKVGPVWSFATDRDATRRKGGHHVFLSRALSYTSQLYGTLSNLPGLNLLTGEHEITLDFDYKHIFKRFCTLIRSRAGMHLNNGRCINSSMLLRYLTWLDDVDDAKANKLLYPEDPQDVPRAVELMSAIIALGKIDLAIACGATPNVDTIADFDAIRILSELFQSLLQPFININLSLTEQVVSLSRFAHLLYSCYHTQRRAFMPNQLYYDTQTFVKNVPFSITKQQKLDPTASFYLLDVGDDPIELLFAFLRMCGGHNSAINYKQSLDRLGAARDIGGVYARNPDLAHGHRRLNLARPEAVDHISRSTWVGNTVSGHCDLPTAWKQGQAEAVQILRATQVPPAAYDFESYFVMGSGIDLMCVFGGGKYPSVNDGDDDEDHSLAALLMPQVRDGDATVAQTDAVEPPPDLPEVDCEDDEPNLEEVFEGILSNSTESDGLDDDTDNSDEQPSPAAPPKGPGVCPADYLWCDKKWVHKQSVCRLIITPDFTPKSQSRLFRVRGFSPVNKRLGDLDIGHVLHGAQFLTGDLFLALIRTHTKVLALALARATSISENGTSRGRINTATLASPRSNVKITGEIMTLVPSTDIQSDDVWIWNGAYLKTTSAVPGTSTTTQKVISISVSGHLLELVNPQVVDAHNHLTPDQAHEINSNGSTWALNDDALRAAVASLWMKIVDSKIPVNSIMSLSSENSRFPYKALNGHDSLVCAAGTEMLLSSGQGKAVASACPVCCESTKDLRSHMGVHILRAARGVPDNVVNPLTGPLPCGFCGESDNPDCALTLKNMTRGMRWETKCPRKEPFQYGSATKGSNTRPCRNVPIVCKLCVHQGRDTDWRPAIWRYNLETHLDQQHPEYAHPGKPSGVLLPHDMYYDALVLTAAEENKAGVPARPEFIFIQDKENTPQAASSARTQKRKTNAQTFATATLSSKRARH